VLERINAGGWTGGTRGQVGVSVQKTQASKNGYGKRGGGGV